MFMIPRKEFVLKDACTRSCFHCLSLDQNKAKLTNIYPVTSLDSCRILCRFGENEAMRANFLFTYDLIKLIRFDSKSAGLHFT